MSDTSADRHEGRGVLLLRSLLCAALLLGPCNAGHRPLERGERRRHDRQSDGATLFPWQHGVGTQWVQFPSMDDHGSQIVQFPDAGSQIEKCIPGYYRDGSGPYLGRCVPCACNGLATDCEDRTGRCLNCQYNTAGKKCERCQEGYYGNAAQRTCRLCPCPFSVPTNSFAVGCREAAGGIQCVCRRGYTGNQCERCAPGFHGDPLTAGGSCQPCNCNGNGNSCDSRTGVCTNTLEPKDTNTDEHCQECDSCAQTLLHDLEKLDEVMGKIKAQFDNATASASSQERLQKLEEAIADTQILVNKFSSTVNSQKPKVSQLEQDVRSLKDDISNLKDKADKREAAADKAVKDVEKTHQNAKNLDAEVQKLLKKIQALLDRLKESGDSSGGDSLHEDISKLLEEAKRMVKEMEKRNFKPQKTAAEKERDEARKLLDYVKANVSQQCDQNQAAAERIRSQLKDYGAKIKEVELALKEAGDRVKKANTQNGLNELELGDLLNLIDDLKKMKKAVQDDMTKAELELQKTEDLLQMLSDRKMEYERLAAQLDGAKTDLTRKVNELSQAANKEDIVRAAEEHAKKLNALAMELQDAVRNASGRTDVRDAIDAIGAYKNITDAINAAEAAANEAKDAADKALSDVKKEDLPRRAKDLKQSGNKLLKDAEDASKDIRSATADLAAKKNRLRSAENKKKALEKDLLDAQRELDSVKRGDIGDMIDEAKRKASAADDLAINTMNRLDDINDELAKIKVTKLDSNLSSVMEDVDKSVKNLLDTIPTLEDKIFEVENLTSQLSPNSNITENIKKIKELIEQARDAANRITVPMKFMGDGHVELRPPTDLDDLKAYTSLSLMLQRPKERGDGKRRRRQAAEPNMFVLYLGNRDSSKDFIGMAMRDDRLYCIYKLNGVEYEINIGTITGSDPNPATFDKVELQRIYQDAQVTFTKTFTSNKPHLATITSNQGKEMENLLNLSPSDTVFYVGGYPANFTPPPSLKYPKYKGCIEFSAMNERFVSLYNFRKAVNINPVEPCKRYLPQKESAYFEGTGYAMVAIDRAQFPLFVQTITTNAENGLLFYIGNEEKYYTVTLDRGFVVINSNLFSKPYKSDSKIFPSAQETEVKIIFEASKKEMIVRVSNKEVAKAVTEYTKGDFLEYYLGGAPTNLRERFNITARPLKGCFTNVKLKSNNVVFDETVGVGNGCPSDYLASRKAEFSLGSSLSADLKGFNPADDVTISLGFKSTENQGLLLQNTPSPAGITLELVDGYVVLRFKDKVWKSNKQYQDEQWHYLTVTKKAERINLLIDDEDAGQEQPPDGVGTKVDRLMYLGKDTFKGCLSNIYTRRPDSLYRAEDLSKFQSSGDVLVDICAAGRPPQSLLDGLPKQDAVRAAVSDSVSECAQPALLQQAYRMGGPASSLSYSLPPHALQPKPHFSLDIRTRSPEGLLFFAATRGGSSHLALYMSKGRIRFSVGKQKEIFNREKYNDGKWHSVIFSLERKRFRLIVDGIKAQDGQLSSDEVASMDFVSPLYLGSAPESLYKQLKRKILPKHSVLGCVRNFKMNGAPLPEPTSNSGAGPCFDGQTQSGAYFSGQGSHVVIPNSFAIDSNFELLFDIRPRNLTGVLLRVGNFSETQHGAQRGHHLSLYMLRGEVVAQVNNGAGEFMVSVMPKTTLCDGEKHRISVIKEKNVVQLHVDTVGNYKIGPPSSFPSLTKDPLYVGGIPGPVVPGSLPVTSSFVGCMQDLKMNGNPVYLERLPGVFGAVNLRECPVG